MKRVDVDKLERLIGQIDSLRQELGALVKKAPNDLVNSFKLRFVNQVLTGVNAFLGKKSIPLEGFTHFEDDAPPSNSDVTFVLAQYAEALDLYRSGNVFMQGGAWYYEIDDVSDDDETIRTSPPVSLARKS
ncbi:MAG: hypothetical protein WCC12_13570 [Anaerolineales bacterium]